MSETSVKLFLASCMGNSSGDEASRQQLSEAPLCFGIFLSATRSRIARRNFSRSAGFHVKSKLHRLRDGFSVSNALLLDQSPRLSRKSLNHRQTMMARRRWKRSFLRFFGTWNFQFRNKKCDPYRRIKGAYNAINGPIMSSQ